MPQDLVDLTQSYTNKHSNFSHQYNNIYTTKFGRETITASMHGNGHIILLNAINVITTTSAAHQKLKGMSLIITIVQKHPDTATANVRPPISDALPPTRTQQDVAIPLWMVLITSNYLHSGGWSSCLHYNTHIDFIITIGFFT